MTFITLFSSQHGFLATDQQVYAPEELEPLKHVIEQANQLDRRLSSQVACEQSALTSAAEQGRSEGFSKGRAEASEHIAQELARLHELHLQAIEQTQADCAGLAVDIVRKIAGDIRSDQWLLAQAYQAAEDIIDQPVINLRVHSKQAMAVRNLLTQSGQARMHSVIADDTLTEQACILDTGSGQIDVSLETQLAAIIAVLADATVSSGPSDV